MSRVAFFFLFQDAFSYICSFIYYWNIPQTPEFMKEFLLFEGDFRNDCSFANVRKI